MNLSEYLPDYAEEVIRQQAEDKTFEHPEDGYGKYNSKTRKRKAGG